MIHLFPSLIVYSGVNFIEGVLVIVENYTTRDGWFLLTFIILFSSLIMKTRRQHYKDFDDEDYTELS